MNPRSHDWRIRRDIQIRRMAREGMTNRDIAIRVPLSLASVRKISKGARRP